MTTEKAKIYCPDYDALKPELNRHTAHAELVRRLLRSDYYKAGKRNNSFSVGYINADDYGFNFRVRCEGTLKIMRVRQNRTISVIS